MPLADDTRAHIETLVRQHDFVLFMKGSRRQPQCGFSAAVVDALDEWLDDYATVDVLSDPAVRDGIKEYSSWPTIPQFYARGEFVGGGDIVRELARSGELAQVTGTARREFTPPSVEVTPSAAAQFVAAIGGKAGDFVHLRVMPRGQYDLSLGPKGENDVAVDCGAITLLLDAGSARRADGLRIDFVEGPGGKGFQIRNVNQPTVRQMSVAELQSGIKTGDPMQVFDVRGEDERRIAKLPFARALDAAGEAALLALPKDTMIVFHCHHGGRSQRAAEHFLNQGFTRVANVVGGIDRWSTEIDPSVPRY